MGAMREVIIKASNREEALKQAQGILKGRPGNILIEEISKEEFKAQLLNADAEVEILVNEERMTASISSISPQVGTGKKLSLKTLTKYMEKAGVGVEFDKEAAAKFIDCVENDKDCKGLVIARGTSVVPGKDALLEPHGDFSYPVFPGDIIAKKIHVVPAVEGTCIDGTAIPPDESSQGKDFPINEEKEFKVDGDGVSIISKVYGLANIEGNHLSIKLLLSIEEDKMCAKMGVYKKDFKGNEITAQKLISFINDEGIITFSALEQGLVAAFKKINPKECPCESILVALGSAPHLGKDGYLELTGDVNKGPVGTERKDGSLDHKDRGKTWCVRQGDLIGTIVEPEEGGPGKDIFANPIDCPQVNPCFVETGDNVKASGDGKEFYAEDEGMVVYSRDILSVNPVHEIDGNVDLESGNIEITKGSVIIKGSVLKGFRVSCPGNIIVEDTVEGAFLTAGGSIKVSRGIAMGNYGEVKADGDVFADFATSANIIAGRDVRIGSSIINSEIFAEGRVIVTEGSGKIRGGRIHSGSCIEANEIGSEEGVPTFLSIDLISLTYRRNLEIKEDLETKIKKIEGAFGDNDPIELMKKLPGEKAEKIRALLGSLKLFNQSLKEIKDLLIKALEEFWTSVDKQIIIHTMLYPDTTIRIGRGYMLKVKEPIPKCIAQVSLVEKEIEISPLT
ncbi:MAG: hypothetical protein ACI9S8_002725 [Chlamydiales bacterium]|jgi:uncharacterized protein (DUF342 family)